MYILNYSQMEIKIAAGMVNLCDICKKSFPECQPTRIEFGNGVGDDNVIKCSDHEEKV
jgi:hypothetical protein